METEKSQQNNRINCTLIAEISNSKIKAFLYSQGLFNKQINFEPNIYEPQRLDRSAGAFELNDKLYIVSAGAADRRGHTRLVDEYKEAFLTVMICACLAHSRDVLDLHLSYDIFLYLTLLDEKNRDELEKELQNLTLSMGGHRVDVKFKLQHVCLEGEMGCLLIEDKYSKLRSAYSIDGGYGTTILIGTNKIKGNSILSSRTIADRKVYRIGASALIDYIIESIEQEFTVQTVDERQHIISQLFNNKFNVNNHRGIKINIEEQCKKAVKQWLKDTRFRGFIEKVKILIDNSHKIALIGGIWNMKLIEETFKNLLLNEEALDQDKEIQKIEEAFFKPKDPRMAPGNRMLKAVMQIENLSMKDLKIIKST